jgi:thiosulfate/3-mercaptopyruvate sulfurtransferase
MWVSTHATMENSMPPLVTTAWLAENIGAPDLLIFDASFFLPTEGQDAPANFRAAHLPGARFFDIDDVADKDTDLPHMVPSAGRFAKKMCEYGISNTTLLVFYDQQPNFRSARALWLMNLFGHDEACVLDGGLAKWVEEGRAVEAGTPPAPTPTTYVPSLRATRLRGLGDMKRNAETQAELVLDARPAGRFYGTAPEPRPDLPNGHMPGAFSIPASDMIGADKVFLSSAALRARFAAAGVDGTKPVVTSCGTGVTAAILTLGLRIAGLPEGALYDGAWTEWASQADTPKVT